MKALVKFPNFNRQPTKWEVMEHTSENRRAWLFEKYGKLKFRILKATSEVEFPPTDYPHHNPQVILHAEQWIEEHAPSKYTIRNEVERMSTEQVITIAKILGIYEEPPLFPLSP